jgi:hypothetical protein
MDPLHVIRLVIAAAGLVDGLAYGSVNGPLTALVLIGIFELISIAHERARIRRQSEDEFHKMQDEARRDASLRDRGLK